MVKGATWMRIHARSGAVHVLARTGALRMGDTP